MPRRWRSEIRRATPRAVSPPVRAAQGPRLCSRSAKLMAHTGTIAADWTSLSVGLATICIDFGSHGITSRNAEPRQRGLFVAAVYAEPFKAQYPVRSGNNSRTARLDSRAWRCRVQGTPDWEQAPLHREFLSGGLSCPRAGAVSLARMMPKVFSTIADL
jgi:hypothetical protein